MSLKLTWEQVIDIRTRYATGDITKAALAKEFGVAPTQICNIIKGRQRKDRRLSPAELLWSNVLIKGADDCWEWQASCNPRNGYGFFRHSSRKKSIGAHRFAYEVSSGVSPGKLHVCHTCDNPKCCNPAHLFLGTPLDNMRDKIAKNRGNAGERESPNPPALAVGSSGKDTCII